MVSSCKRWCVMVCLVLATGALAAGRSGPPGVTSLTNPKVRFEEPAVHQIELTRGPVRITVVDNVAVGAHHRAGYNGVASLTHQARRENLFVREYAGLNFELIHDGTHVPRDRMMEPRRAPMRLRRIDGHTVELHQPPTPTWALESCTRFHLLKDGAIEMTFECVPRKPVFKQGYIGLFWASYIDKPESKAIHFVGRPRTAGPETEPAWIEAITPKHGVESTHVGAHDRRRIEPAPDFPAHYMVFSHSKCRYTEPYYYGVSHGMALALVFRRGDLIRFTQSPSGGGAGCPAWDFQYMIPDYEVDKPYGFVMRAVYVPLRDRETLQTLCRRHQTELERGQTAQTGLGTALLD